MPMRRRFVSVNFIWQNSAVLPNEFGKTKRAYIEGTNRVIRGGSWNNNAANCRTSNRNNPPPDNRNNNVGFRLLFVPQ